MKKKMKLNQNNWQKIKLGKICKIVSGTTPNTNESLFWNGTLPWITPAEIHETSHIICETERFITEKAVEKNALKLLPKGTVLLTSRAPIGKVGIAGIEMYCNQGFKNLICSDEIYNEYLYFFLKFKSKYLDYLGRGATFKEISKSIVENVLILLPPLSEQHRIVAVLETWDKAISLTKRLIEQKEIQKKHLMRQLLTGKTRLKGFVDTWVEEKLGTLLIQQSNKNKNLSITQVLSVTNRRGFVRPEEQFSKKVASENLSNYKIVKKGEFAYNPARINVGSIALLEEFENGILSPMYVVFKCSTKIDPFYFKYWIKTSDFINKVSASTQGSVRATVDFNNLSAIKFIYPTDIKEQQSIAEVLSVADKEISLLKEKLAKLQQQKKGLMQILLTGKVRLN